MLPAQHHSIPTFQLKRLHELHNNNWQADQEPGGVHSMSAVGQDLYIVETQAPR